jgi:hypothetical protein
MAFSRSVLPSSEEVHPTPAKMPLTNAAVTGDRDCSNMCLHLFHTRSTVIYWRTKSQRKPETQSPPVKGWSQNGYGMIVGGLSELMSSFGDISLFGNVNGTAGPLLPLDNRSVRYDLMVYRAL